MITEYRNGDDPYANGQHRGLDIGAATGTPAVAAVGGTVRYRGVAGSNGLTVSIRTADGRYDTSYLHLESAAVEKGQTVAGGERIGTVGTSGRRSAEAPHLHFGVREAGSRHAYLDPRGFLGAPPAPRLPEPRGAPVPVQAPVPVAPAPAPVTVPVVAPSPVRVPVARRVRGPVPRGVRVPAVPRVRVPSGVRSPSPVLSPRLPSPDRVGVGAPALAPVPELGPVSQVGPARAEKGRLAPSVGGPALGPQPSQQPAEARPPGEASPVGSAGTATAHPEAPGPDIGWAIACVGLLLAAACVGGRPGDRGGQRRPRSAGLRALLKPLTGGR